MQKFEQPKIEKEKEEELYQQRADFVKEHYPAGKSNYEVDDLLAQGLDGKKVLEKKDQSGDPEGILTYELGNDHEDVAYCSIGIMLTREESEGEGVMGGLLDDVKKIAEENDCEYLVAVADTNNGEQFLLGKGFYSSVDPVNGRAHLRCDL